MQLDHHTMLDLHNRVRADEHAVDMQEMVGSGLLDEYTFISNPIRFGVSTCNGWPNDGRASVHSNTHRRICVGVARRVCVPHLAALHSRPHRFVYIGENLAAGTAEPTVTDIIERWAVKERPNFDYATNKCIAGKMCGHYTQVEEQWA
jgi:hypothetical protein